MPNQIKDHVLECFERNLGIAGLKGQVVALPNGEAWVTISAAAPTPAMQELARMLEAEFEERGKAVTIFIKPTGRGWLGRIKATFSTRAA